MLEKIFRREITMTVVSTDLYNLYDERRNLQTVGPNEKLTPAEYKQGLDILYLQKLLRELEVVFITCILIWV